VQSFRKIAIQRRAFRVIISSVRTIQTLASVMKIWTSEHVFGHNWETVVQSQFRKYPNPHNTNVLGTDVVDRVVDAQGRLHSHRIITSDWKLSPWVQRLIGFNRECYAHEYSLVDPAQRLMEMKSVNLTFCSFVEMKEQMSYFPHPEDSGKTLLRQETLVTVKGVPLTSYMEALIVNTVSANSSKGKSAIEWVVDKIEQESRNVSGLLDKLQLEVQELKNTVSDNLINTAKKAIDELKVIHAPIMVQAESAAAAASASASATAGNSNLPSSTSSCGTNNVSSSNTESL